MYAARAAMAASASSSATPRVCRHVHGERDGGVAEHLGDDLGRLTGREQCFDVETGEVIARARTRNLFTDGEVGACGTNSPAERGPRAPQAFLLAG